MKEEEEEEEQKSLTGTSLFALSSSSEADIALRKKNYDDLYQRNLRNHMYQIIVAWLWINNNVFFIGRFR